KSRDRIRFGSNPNDMYFDGRWFDVPRWQGFVHELLGSIEDILSTHLLFIRGKPLPTIDLYQFVDDPNIPDAGYWFAIRDEKEWEEGRRRVLNNLRGCEKE